MTEREMLEMAAKSVGIVPFMKCGPNNEAVPSWNPLDNDGDAFRLAVTLRVDVTFNDMHVIAFPANGSEGCAEPVNVDNPMAATRLAITRAAAEIGRSMK